MGGKPVKIELMEPREKRHRHMGTIGLGGVGGGVAVTFLPETEKNIIGKTPHQTMSLVLKSGWGRGHSIVISNM